MRVGARLILLSFFVVCSSCVYRPKLPRAFSADFTLAILPFASGQDIFSGRYALDYDANAGMLHLQDSSADNAPFLLQTTTIGHPLPSLNKTEGFEFLNEGRCWYLGNLSQEYFHYFPLEIPPDANFIFNKTIDGQNTGIWQWSYSIYSLIEVTFEMGVRWSDGGIMYFNTKNTFLITFTIEWTFNNVQVGMPDKGTFERPRGPCPPNPYGTVNSGPDYQQDIYAPFHDHEETAVIVRSQFELVKKHLGRIRDQFTVIPEFIQQLQQYEGRPISSNQAGVTPPTLHQYFSSDYDIGVGNLTQANHWQGNRSILEGFMAFDKEKNGLYFNINAPQNSDVPYIFTTSIIGDPEQSDPKNTHGFMYLASGRCWDFGINEFISPDIPLTIPPDAKYMGNHLIDGVLNSIWEFPGSFEYVSGTIRMAVNVKTHAITFINAMGYGYGVFIRFRNFNVARPPPNTYASPAGPCTDFFPPEKRNGMLSVLDTTLNAMDSQF